MTRLKEKYGLLIIGIALGVLFGVLIRLYSTRSLASVTFLFITPMVLGMIPLMFANTEKLRSYRTTIFVPSLTYLAFFLAMFLLRIEEILCLMILGAPFFVLSLLGAFIYRLVRINREKNKGKLLTLVALPFLLVPLEGYIKAPSDTFSIHSEVIVKATPEEVWENIVEVKTIEEQEYSAGVFNKLGIPRPISASVDRREVGGHRTGHFEGGLKFTETITEYLPNKKVAFNIQVAPETVRPRIFDQHVLKGNYFTFVDATYELTELGDGLVKLNLSSRYQLTSTINFYGKFWGDIILSDFQERLLKVIAKRCEAEAGSGE